MDVLRFTVAVFCCKPSTLVTLSLGSPFELELFVTIPENGTRVEVFDLAETMEPSLTFSNADVDVFFSFTFPCFAALSPSNKESKQNKTKRTKMRNTI